MPPPPGRGNGLSATSYVPLVDLDPQLADTVLELLRDEGIAAYAAPAIRRSAGDIVVARQDRLLDRIHVDRGASLRARTLLAARLPRLRAEHEAAWRPPVGGDPAPGSGSTPVPTPGSTPGPASESASAPAAPGEDAAWASILAAWEAPAHDPRLPAEDGSAEPVAGTDRAGGDPGPGTSSAGPDAGPLADDRPVEPAEPPQAQPQPQPRSTAEPDDDHFVPPTPPPLPRLDAVGKAAWLGVVGGPLLLLLTVLLGLSLDPWLAALALLGFVGGFVTLVARMKDDPPDDDGAVV